MSKRDKEHRKKVAARNAKLSKGAQMEAKLLQDIKSGMATPNQARAYAKIQERKNKFGIRNFQRKSS